MVRAKKKRALRRFVIEVKEKGFPKGELETIVRGKRRLRTFKTKQTAARAAKALMRKRKGEIISLKGKKRKLTGKNRTAKIRKAFIEV